MNMLHLMKNSGKHVLIIFFVRFLLYFIFEWNILMYLTTIAVEIIKFIFISVQIHKYWDILNIIKWLREKKQKNI